MNLDGDLRSCCGGPLLRATDGGALDERKHALSCGFGLEAEHANNARPGYAGYTRRTRSIDHDIAGAIVAMDQSYCLVVAGEQIAAADVDQGELSWIVLNLQGNRSDVFSAGEHDRNLECGARSHRVAGRAEQ